MLISGEGILLQHSFNGDTKTDHLSELLQASSFDGGSKTQGRLINDKITDFNVMTKIGEYKVEVSTYTKQETVKIKPCDLCFVYSLTDEVTATTSKSTQQIPTKHLLKISSPMTSAITVSGEMMMVIHLFKIKTLTR